MEELFQNYVEQSSTSWFIVSKWWGFVSELMQIKLLSKFHKTLQIYVNKPIKAFTVFAIQDWKPNEHKNVNVIKVNNPTLQFSRKIDWPLEKRGLQRPCLNAFSRRFKTSFQKIWLNRSFWWWKKILVCKRKGFSSREVEVLAGKFIMIINTIHKSR